MLSTPGGDSNLDNIIKKNFFTEVQQRRVKTEIQYLKELDQNCYKVSLQSTPIGLKILVNLTKNFIQQEIKEADKLVFPIVFEFLLEPKFPFVFPKLLCKTSFFTPNLADGRDFAEDVIQRMWNPSILLRDIVIYIPDFLKRLMQLTIPEESQLLGKYYLGHLYNLEDFITMDTAHVFPGTEMINEQSVNNERYFIIIESYFLNFESVDKARNTLRLISWAHVGAISRIKRNKDDPKMLVFLWHDNDKKGVLVQNVFILDQTVEMVETIARMGQKYANVTDVIKKQRDLPLSEVTAKNYRDMDIEELLENIAMLESKLEAEPSVDVINLLMNLYQKAVEYFSALSDPAYSEFVEKLHDLLNREDIQIILKSGEGEQTGQGKRASASKKAKERTRPSQAEENKQNSKEARAVEHVKEVEQAKRAGPPAGVREPEEPKIIHNEEKPAIVHVQHHNVEKQKEKEAEEQQKIPKEAEATVETAVEQEETVEVLEPKEEEKQNESEPVSQNNAENTAEEEKSNQEPVQHKPQEVEAQAEEEAEIIEAKPDESTPVHVEHEEKHEKKEKEQEVEDNTKNTHNDDHTKATETFVPQNNDDMFDIGDDDD